MSKCPKNYESFENVFVTLLEKKAPRKTKILRRNQKPHVNKNLRKAIMKRSELKSKANRTKRPNDISDYKKQRNLVVTLNREELSILKFWKHRKTLNHFGTSVNPIFLTNMPMDNLKLF